MLNCTEYGDYILIIYKPLIKLTHIVDIVNANCCTSTGCHAVTQKACYQSVHANIIERITIKQLHTSCSRVHQ